MEHTVSDIRFSGPIQVTKAKIDKNRSTLVGSLFSKEPLLNN